MSYRPSGTQNLPVVMYAPGVYFPGASHAAAPGRPRAHPAARLPCGGPLLAPAASLVALAAASLVALAALRHYALPAAARTAALPAAVRPARSTVPRASRWDTRLSATPRPGQFVRFFRMKATAYTPINTRMEGGRYTVTRRDGRAAHGVAVDPGLIPLGSRLWIPGYGHAVADDIGGRIHGHHVDIRVQVYGHMGRWGVRPVRVYVLQEPKP